MKFWHGHVWRMFDVQTWKYSENGILHTTIHLVCDCGKTKEYEHLGKLDADKINLLAKKKGWRGTVRLKNE